MARLFLALVLSAFITVSLFYVMQALIKGDGGKLEEPPAGNILDFVRVKQEEVVEQKDRKPQKPPKPKEPPPQMSQPQLDSSADTEGFAMDFSADISADVALGDGLALESGDGEYLPIVKVAPSYPRRAQSRGIEGYVIVEFTVTKQGTVRDPVVVKAEPQGLFDRAALDAVLKFKYKPRVINGEPAAVSGVQNRITFELDG